MRCSARPGRRRASARLSTLRVRRQTDDAELPMNPIRTTAATTARWPRRRVLTMGAFGMAAAALAAMGCKNDGKPAGAGGLAKVRLALDWTPNTNHTGFWVAEKQ